MDDALRPYAPSNGTEGEWFMSKWCAKCSCIDFDDDDSICDILGRSMAFDFDDPEYPTEWVTSEATGPKCTAFRTNPLPEPRCEKTPDLFGDAQ